MFRYLILFAALATGCSPPDAAIIGPSPTQKQLDAMVRGGEAFSIDTRTGEIKGSPPSGVVPLPPPPLPK